MQPYDHPALSRAYFFPQPPCPLPLGVRAGPGWLEVAGVGRVSVYRARPLDAAPTLLYFHGNGERIDDQLERWPDWAQGAGLNSMYVDYPGYGLSEGSPSLSSCCATARAALQALLDAPADEVPGIVVMGRSVGSIFALHAASSLPSPRLRGLVLESGVADLVPRLAMRVRYEALGLDREAVEAALRRDFDHRARLASLTVPVLVLHCQEDGLVPVHNGAQLAAWAGERLFALELFEVGDHNSIQQVNAPAYRARLADFARAVRKEKR